MIPKRLDERLWSKVQETADCWLFMGSLTRDRTSPAHRVAYELTFGPIPAGLTIDYLCRVRNCVNPNHLEPVTAAENTRRGTGGINFKNADLCRNRLHPWPESAREFNDGWKRCDGCYRARIARRSAKRTAAQVSA